MVQGWQLSHWEKTETTRTFQLECFDHKTHGWSNFLFTATNSLGFLCLFYQNRLHHDDDHGFLSVLFSHNCVSAANGSYFNILYVSCCSLFSDVMKQWLRLCWSERSYDMCWFCYEVYNISHLIQIKIWKIGINMFQMLNWPINFSQTQMESIFWFHA